MWIETHNHIELYDQTPYAPQAVAALVAFPDKHLARAQMPTASGAAGAAA